MKAPFQEIVVAGKSVSKMANILCRVVYVRPLLNQPINRLMSLPDRSTSLFCSSTTLSSQEVGSRTCPSDRFIYYIPPHTSDTNSRAFTRLFCVAITVLLPSFAPHLHKIGHCGHDQLMKAPVVRGCGPI